MTARTNRAAAWATALTVMFVPLPTIAQEGFIAPSVAVGIVHDDNTFATSGASTGDTILRVSPALEGGWRGPRGEFRALHTFDAERYRDNSQLDDAMIRRRTELDLDYALSPRTRIAAGASTAATDAPGDLVPEIGLEFGRAGAERHTIEGELAHRLTERAGFTVGAGWTGDEVDGGAETTTTLASVAGDYRANPRHTWTAEYQYRRYDFDGLAPIDAQIGLFGWNTALTPRLSLVVQAGPRYTDGDTTPEVFVGLTQDTIAGQASIHYARTQLAVIGQRGLADSHSAWATLRHALNVDMDLLLTPSYSQLERGPRSVDVVRLTAEARYRMTQRVSLRGSYQWSRQDGSLESLLPVEITRNVIYIGAVVDFIPQPATAPENRRQP